MIQIWSLNKNIAGIPCILGMFLHKEDALRMQQEYKNMYHDDLELKERVVCESIYEIDVSGV